MFHGPPPRKRRYFESDPEYDPFSSLNIESGIDQSFLDDVPTNNSSIATTSQSPADIQPAVSQIETPDIPSDFIMDNSDISSTIFIDSDPLANMNINVNPSVTDETEEGELI